MKQFDKMTCVGQEEKEELAALGIDSEIIPNGTNIPELKDTINELHDYSVPELLILPVIDGLEKYMSWVLQETT